MHQQLRRNNSLNVWMQLSQSTCHNPTRKNAILDLIITDEPDMIQEVSDLGVFGSSDHIALDWNLLVRSETARNAREVFDYSKADVAGIRQNYKL